MLDNERFAGDLAQMHDDDVANMAYEVKPAPEGSGLVRGERTPAGDVQYTTEPQTNGWLRTKIEMLSILPIEWFL